MHRERLFRMKKPNQSITQRLRIIPHGLPGGRIQIELMARIGLARLTAITLGLFLEPFAFR